jgi:prepilin-type N-terminal cleavage/methylation domain-containing protein
MEKEKGITLIELLIAMAIFLILMSMLGPLIKSIAQSGKKSQEITQLDLNVGRAMDVFKRSITASKDMGEAFGTYSPPPDTSTTSGIYISNIDGIPTGTTTGIAIVINVPKLDKDKDEDESDKFVDEKVIFYISNGRLMINSTENKTGNFSTVFNPTVLIRNLIEEQSFFRYEEKVALMEMTIWLDKEKTESRTVREAAVTRINIQF